MAHKETTFSRSLVVIVCLGLFGGLIAPIVAYADNPVVTEYITEIKLNVRAAYKDPTRSYMLGHIDTMAQCLNNNNNWQTGNVTTLDQLKTQLHDNEGHPCATEYMTVVNIRDEANQDISRIYPTLIRSARTSGLTHTIGVQMRDNVSWSQKFEAYFDCLMRETNGHPNWQFGSSPPTTVAGLQSAVQDNDQHPCHQARADLEAASATSSPTASSTPTSSASTAASSHPTSQPSSSTSNSSGLGADNRPIFDRIVPPRSSDVLTPDFAKQNNPSIGGLVNYLFDLLVRRILPLLVGVLVIVIMWAGFQYIMAQGDSAKAKQAKDTILFGIIGLVLALAAFSIITILNNLILHA